MTGTTITTTVRCILGDGVFNAVHQVAGKMVCTVDGSTAALMGDLLWRNTV
jgi:hypothetical protein